MKKKYITSWNLERAYKNLKYFKTEYGKDVELWMIFDREGKYDSTWKYFIVKTPNMPLMDCQDAHFSDLQGHEINYIRLAGGRNIT